MDNTRRIYLDNIRWITVVIVVIYHVIYMFNGVQPFGVIGPFKKHQLQDAFQYVVYPWFMALLFVVSGMSARYYLEKHDTKTFVREKTRKLLVPSTIGLLVFQWILGYYNLISFQQCRSRFCMGCLHCQGQAFYGTYRCCGYFRCCFCLCIELRRIGYGMRGQRCLSGCLH